MNIIGNLYVSNGMSAGNTANEARVQGLSEVFERHIKNRIIAESISLPEIPQDVLARYPGVVESIKTLEAEGFPIFAYDGSLGGKYPVICVVNTSRSFRPRPCSSSVTVRSSATPKSGCAPKDAKQVPLAGLNSTTQITGYLPPRASWSPLKR